MMRRFCFRGHAAPRLSMPPAHAEWYAREEAIMGTRIAVEVWQDDPAAAELPRSTR